MKMRSQGRRHQRVVIRYIVDKNQLSVRDHVCRIRRSPGKGKLSLAFNAFEANRPARPENVEVLEVNAVSEFEDADLMASHRHNAGHCATAVPTANNRNSHVISRM
jgi:hypothetical protein